MILLRLFWEFFKTGLFAVGGGLATLPFLTDMAEKTGWFTIAELTDMVAVSESTPGPIGVNMATYAGFKTAGISGAVIASLGLIAPSIIIILLVAMFLDAFRKNKYVDRAFYGIRAASSGLIASAAASLLVLCLIDRAAYEFSGRLSDLIFWKGVLLFAVIWVLTNLVPKVKKWHPLVFIAFSAVIGIVFNFAGAM